MFPIDLKYFVPLLSITANQIFIYRRPVTATHCIRQKFNNLFIYRDSNIQTSEKCISSTLLYIVVLISQKNLFDKFTTVCFPPHVCITYKCTHVHLMHRKWPLDMCLCAQVLPTTNFDPYDTLDLFVWQPACFQTLCLSNNRRVYKHCVSTHSQCLQVGRPNNCPPNQFSSPAVARTEFKPS